jgi:hypothetical protein
LFFAKIIQKIGRYFHVLLQKVCSYRFFAQKKKPYREDIVSPEITVFLPF